MSSSGSGSVPASPEDYGDVSLLYAKLVAQVLSTAMSAFVGTRHVLQIVALKQAEHARRQLQTPMLAAADHCGRRYTGGGNAPTPPMMNLAESPALHGPSCNTTANTHTSDDTQRRQDVMSYRVQQRENALYAPVGGPDLSTNEEDDDRPRVSVASRILRVMCLTDFIFSLSGVVVTAVELWVPAHGDSFQLMFWAQAPHWCSQVASFCWVATLALYIAKRKNRSSFDVAIAHAIIWMLVVFYWVLELYSSYYDSTEFVNAAKIIWKVMAVGNFMIISLCWMNFARRWRRQERRRGAYVVSKLASYTLAFFVFVGPIVITDLAKGLHSSGAVMDTASVILAMWPFVNAVIYLTKPSLCLRIFQASPNGGKRGTKDSSDGLPNGLHRPGSRRFMGGANGSGDGLSGGLGTDGSGQKLLMSPSHHELKGLEIGDKIGEGVAVVYLGKWRGANVAVKMKAVLAALESAADLAEFQHACNASQTKAPSTTKTPVVEMTGLVGTTRWMAPEVMRGERIYTSKVDIYSLALILWELIEGKLPFENTRWNHEVEDFVLKGVRPNIRSDLCPLRWKLLIVTCWQADPLERPTIQQVINSLQRIGREEVWDPTGPRFTGVSQLGTSLSSSVSSYLDSPSAGISGMERRNNNTFNNQPLDENHASESDSDAESFAEEFSYVPTLESVSPAVLGGSSESSHKSNARSRSRRGSMETAASSRLSAVSSTSSTVSMGCNDSGYFGNSHVISMSDSSGSMISNGSSVRDGSLSGSRSLGASRTPKMKKKRPEWRRRTDTIQETQPMDLIDTSPHTFVESSPNGTPFIVNI
ncbi:hypothetical protein PHYBOEH_002686 [Phytophthora boehmeriae]|uniref:Protein kinase domain-containing protein n=1 Tax=Phytophthora boehmeriae TaxID=109152 RepID=A0A8T1XA14_9STRA|nr:hypothetical protein PHYBOEH_002686 [Phytophthora boehmeriae]